MKNKPSDKPSASPSVSQRCLFYVSGFDPKGASHYHALYREQAALQSALTGQPIAVGARGRNAAGNPVWTVDSAEQGAAVHTAVEFLRWDDIVRQNWPKGHLPLWRDIVATTLVNLRQGALWRMLGMCWPPVVALFGPFVWLCAMLLGIPLAVGGGAAAGQALGGLWGLGAGALLALAAAGLAARRLEQRFGMYWLMRSYAFTARQARGQTPELEARLDQHARTLVARVAQSVDGEILVVGHSSGAIMATSIVARALQLDPQLGQRGPVLSVLTLGHCTPMLACLPQAQRFRAELQSLGTAQGLHWLDFSAPPDACCFALVDPLQPLPGDPLPPSPRQPDRPKLLSPRFAQMFDAARYAPLRRDKFRIHFQYLMASQQVVDYDYFAITAGAQTLAQRFAHLPSEDNFTGLQVFKRFRRFRRS